MVNSWNTRSSLLPWSVPGIHPSNVSSSHLLPKSLFNGGKKVGPGTKTLCWRFRRRQTADLFSFMGAVWMSFTIFLGSIVHHFQHHRNFGKFLLLSWDVPRLALFPFIIYLCASLGPKKKKLLRWEKVEEERRLMMWPCSSSYLGSSRPHLLLSSTFVCLLPWTCAREEIQRKRRHDESSGGWFSYVLGNA